MEISSRVRPRGASVLAAFMAMLVAASFAYSTAPGPAPFSAPSEPGLLSHTNSTGVRYHAIPTDNPDDGKSATSTCLCSSVSPQDAPISS